jgi:hypothetical protein
VNHSWLGGGDVRPTGDEQVRDLPHVFGNVADVRVFIRKGKSMQDSAKTSRPVVVFTQWKGVFFGYVEGSREETYGKDILSLKNCKMLINFRNGKGVFQVTSEGPVGNCLVSSVCPEIEIRGITGVSEVSPEAEKVWASK